MWFKAACVGLLAAAGLVAQGSDSSELIRAQEEFDRVRNLVEAGVLPPSRLAEAQKVFDDARDEAILRRTLYGTGAVEDLTEEQAEEMVNAASRRFERQRKKIEQMRGRVEAGVVSRVSLTPLLEEGDRRRRTFDLAASRARSVQELAAIAGAERLLAEKLESAPEAFPGLMERFDGHGVFRPEHFRMVARAFQAEFAKPLPVSANGATAVHRAMGFDHQGRVDVALDPDAAEGVWLRRYLEASGIPYYAFRVALPGRSTAPHIHIGPPSVRIRSAG